MAEGAELGVVVGGFCLLLVWREKNVAIDIEPILKWNYYCYYCYYNIVLLYMC